MPPNPALAYPKAIFAKATITRFNFSGSFSAGVASASFTSRLTYRNHSITSSAVRTHPDFPTELTEAEEDAGFVLMEVENPHNGVSMEAYQFYRVVACQISKTDLVDTWWPEETLAAVPLHG